MVSRIGLNVDLGMCQILTSHLPGERVVVPISALDELRRLPEDHLSMTEQLKTVSRHQCCKQSKYF